MKKSHFLKYFFSLSTIGNIHFDLTNYMYKNNTRKLILVEWLNCIASNRPPSSEISENTAEI